MGNPDFSAIIHTYFRSLEKADLAGVLNLFSPDGIIYSPVYGIKEIEPFYRGLFEDTDASEIEVRAIMANLEDPLHFSARFSYNWKRKNKEAVIFEGVDLFTCTKEGKFKKLEIIYDTSVLN